MATSQNGWSVIENYGPPALTGNIDIPGADGARLLGGLRSGPVATVLLWVATQFHQRVDRLQDVADEWAYNYRPIRGQASGFSNHASGTAIDLNASKFPMGSRKMTAAQIAQCRAITAEAGVVRWGGEWSGSGVDQMHFEIVGSAAAVEAAARRLSGSVAVNPTPPVPTTPSPSQTAAPAFQLPQGHYIGDVTGPKESRSGDPRYDGPEIRATIKAAQARLNHFARAYGRWSVVAEDGLFGPATKAATRAFQSLAGGLVVDGLIGRATWSRLFA